MVSDPFTELGEDFEKCATKSWFSPQIRDFMLQQLEKWQPVVGFSDIDLVVKTR